MEPPPTPCDLATASPPSWPMKKRARGARRPRPVPRRCWADLSYGPAAIIAERALANDVSDYMSFRATELPELGGHLLLGATTEGLLALLDESTYVVRLLNPATRQTAELLSLDPLLPPETRARIISEERLAHALQVTGLGLAGGSTFAICFFEPAMLVAAKPGDDQWTLVERWRRFYSGVSFSGRFCCVHDSAILVLEATAAANQPPRLAVAARTWPVYYHERGETTLHLVESDGKLLLLRCRSTELPGGGPYIYRPWSDDNRWTWTMECKVRAVDFAARRTVQVRGIGYGLGGCALFLGRTRALLVSPRAFPSIHGNTVYRAADLSKEVIRSYCAIRARIECCNAGTDDDGWAGPCGIDDYVSWYVSDNIVKASLRLYNRACRCCWAVQPQETEAIRANV
ncbi:hypothetical protein BS78_02G322800 [Paspalum vaginatum]|nr:hypothetical protein BS78_02G322800 [Paspalum vaginatum]